MPRSTTRGNTSLLFSGYGQVNSSLIFDELSLLLDVLKINNMLFVYNYLLLKLMDLNMGNKSFTLDQFS